jgi:hypothetical protein
MFNVVIIVSMLFIVIVLCILTIVLEIIFRSLTEIAEKVQLYQIIVLHFIISVVSVVVYELFVREEGW